MLPRVDYLVLLLALGVLLGFAGGSKRPDASPERLARAYFVAFTALAALLALRLAAFALVGLTPPIAWSFGSLRDASILSFGSLFGLALALRRRGARPGERAEGGALRAFERFLRSPDLLQGLCLFTGMGFIEGGLERMFIDEVRDFFLRSGYSTAFFRFIAAAEVLGGAGLFVPFTALPAAACLAALMFGAVMTHVNNGDDFNDNVQALAMLLLLGAILSLRLLRPSAPGAAPRRG